MKWLAAPLSTCTFPIKLQAGDTIVVDVSGLLNVYKGGKLYCWAPINNVCATDKYVKQATAHIGSSIFVPEAWSIPEAKACIAVNNRRAPIVSKRPWMLSGQSDQEKTPCGCGAKGVRWLASGMLGAKINPPVPFVPSAWDFAAGTYTMQPNDTLDGLAQTYLGCPAGSYVQGGTACINAILNANLPVSGRPSCFKSPDVIYAGCTIRMPQKAIDNALAMLAQAQAACASAGNDWDNVTQRCVPHATPGGGGGGGAKTPKQACIDAGHVWDDATNTCSACKVGLYSYTDPKTKQATCVAKCPNGTTLDAKTNSCKPAAAKASMIDDSIWLVGGLGALLVLALASGGKGLATKSI